MRRHTELAEWPRLADRSDMEYRLSKSPAGEQIKRLLTVIIADDFPSALLESAFNVFSLSQLMSLYVTAILTFFLSLLGLSGDLETVPHHSKSYLANPQQPKNSSALTLQVLPNLTVRLLD